MSEQVPLLYYDESTSPKGGDIEAGGFGPSEIQKEHRKAFIRKVYGILTFQLFVTTLLSCCMVFVPPITNYICQHAWPYYLAIVLSIVLLIALLCSRRVHPINMILLTIWTFTIAYTIGVVCAIYTEAGLGLIVIEALVLTLSVFVGLTIFTFQSKIDFSFLGAGLFCCLWILVIWGLINMLFDFTGGINGMLYSLFGAVLFSLYIIFDTYMIIKRYGYDDYVLGAISLYLDIVNLFLFILRLLSGGRRN